MNSLVKKIGVKPEMRGIIINAPPEVREAMQLPGRDFANKLAGSFDYIHLFVKRRDDLDAEFPRLKSHLRKAGMLWVSWQKGGRLETDLTLGKVIEIGYSHGLVESK